ncbi:autotransporter-associated beta strand repeat-containing protein [Luteolibacter yonseiensis]|uniref:Autotransporter-associated beta strand repeat-containing protein n=1 Tax=Luteolibacter yonseiensis TaxID=1144680 RepID=A0A934R3L2_9BACT|nr:autotransporter-associated beta strand repeat-containing protein [Luteolibacter yonseiensis]MBK1815443.1 autotransporter-associated beta strand repeat-containing protein [Luteolibacter yonseiensis]
MKNKLSLLSFLTLAASTQLHAATRIWDGGTGGTGTDLGQGINWSGDTLPSAATPDTAQWDGSVTGPLTLLYTTANIGGTSGNGGINLDVTSGQTSSLTLDSGAVTSAIRINNVTLASGSGAFKLGDAANAFNITLGGAGGQTHTWTNNSANTATIESEVRFGMGGSGTHTLALDGSGNWEVKNNLAASNAGAILNVSKAGAGSLIVSGTSVFATGSLGAINISAGKTDIVTNGSMTPIGITSVGTSAVTNAQLLISGGSFNANVGNNAYDASISAGTTSGGAGDIRLTSGTLTVKRQLGLGTSSGGYGAYTQTGGTASVGGFLAIGLGTGTGVFNQSAGSYTNSAGAVTNGAGTGSRGVMNLGGTAIYNQSGTGDTGIWLGENGNGTLNVSGSATLTMAAVNNGIQLGRFASGSGTFNLNGGTVTTFSVNKGAGAGTLNLNGGTLKAAAANAGFLTGLTSAFVNSNSTVDNNGFAVTIGQALLAPTGDGVSATGLGVSGGGFINTPLVTITGGGGSGATAVANIDASGNLTGITMTNPGVGYTSAPTFALVGGGSGNTGAITGTATLAANTSGGLTFTGTSAGSTTLAGASTFAGDITISGGISLIANRSNNTDNPTSSALGNNQVSRVINITGGSTLQFNAGDTLGSAVSNFGTRIVVGPGSTVTNGGGVFNRLGSLDLNGGTLSTVSGAVAGYQSYSFDANAVVTVGGSAASAISAGAGAFSGVHLNTNTEFNVSDATGGSAADLVISAPLIDRNGSESAAGGLKKTGAGTLTISSASTYTGPTAVEAGTLLVNGSLGDTAVTVASGATLGGTGGSIGVTTGSVDVAVGGILAPGSSIGGLIVNGSVTVAGTYSFEYDGGTGTADSLDVNGTLTLNNATLVLNDLAGNSYTPGEKFTLFAYDSLTPGSLFSGYSDDTGYTFGGGDWIFNYDDTTAGQNGGIGTRFITITAVPEPTTALLGALGLMALLRRRRA